MTQSIALVGRGDRQLEQLFRARGLNVLTWSERDLSAHWQQGSAVVHYVLIDQREQASLPSSLDSFHRQHPAVPILMLLSALDPALMLEAMRSGVRECLRDPVTAEDIDAALRRIALSREAGPSGDVFAFLGAKGGVGTTTAAVNVATELARMHTGSVLMLDLHLAYGDAAVYLGADSKFSIADALENIHRLDAAFLKSLCVRTKAGPDLLASPDRHLALPIDAGRVRSLIEAAARHYRYVVLDVCRTDPAVLDALDPVKKVLVIANQELATVRGASRMAVALNQRYGKDRVVLAVSRYDPNAGIGQSDIERVVGAKVRHLLPSDYRIALEALNLGRPLALSNQTRLAASFKVLARELADTRDDSEEQKGGKRIFGRLIGRS